MIDWKKKIQNMTIQQIVNMLEIQSETIELLTRQLKVSNLALDMAKVVIKNNTTIKKEDQ